MEPRTHRVHFMGIAGSGASACAAIAQAQGYEVTGCDVSAYSEYKDELTALGITVQNFHNPSHLDQADLLVVSPAILHADPENQEIQQAKSRGIRMMTWQEFSGEFLQRDKYVIAIAGTHGKSTTTALTGLILEAAGLDPTVQVGAIVPNWQKNYRIGKSQYFVIEADEYNDNFLYYNPTIAAITNIEYDHPEHFDNEQSYRHAFELFVHKVKSGGKILVPTTVDHQIQSPDLVHVSDMPTVPLKILGQFNRENAAMAQAIAKTLGVDQAVINQTLQTFMGIARRFTLVGEAGGIKIFDDYAHHPTAVLKTAQAAREQFRNAKIWLVYQPHMYTRTQVLLDDFIRALREAPVDTIIVTDIFASREQDTGKVSSMDLVNGTQKESVKYIATLLEAEKMLIDQAKSGDVIITMGAGDITMLSKSLLKDLQGKGS